MATPAPEKAPEKLKGYLTITIAEASGRNRDDEEVWDPAFVEGYVKVEIRGGPRNIKVVSSTKRVLANAISWQEDITCEILEGASELRIMLCKEKRSPTTSRIGSSVVAACGIFVEDILDAVPIDKYFELFKPGAGGDGGFIRVAMNYDTQLAAAEQESSAAQEAGVPFQPQLSFNSYSRAPAPAPAAPQLVEAVEVAKPAATVEPEPAKKDRRRIPLVKIGMVVGASAITVLKLLKKV